MGQANRATKREILRKVTLATRTAQEGSENIVGNDNVDRRRATGSSGRQAPGGGRHDTNRISSQPSRQYSGGERGRRAKLAAAASTTCVATRDPEVRVVGIRAGLITWSSNLGSTSSGSNTRIDRTKKTKRNTHLDRPGQGVARLATTAGQTLGALGERRRLKT